MKTIISVIIPKVFILFISIFVLTACTPEEIIYKPNETKQTELNGEKDVTFGFFDCVTYVDGDTYNYDGVKKYSTYFLTYDEFCNEYNLQENNDFYVIDNYSKYINIYCNLTGCVIDSLPYEKGNMQFSKNVQILIRRTARSSAYIKATYQDNTNTNMLEVSYPYENDLGTEALFYCFDLVTIPRSNFNRLYPEYNISQIPFEIISDYGLLSFYNESLFINDVNGFYPIVTLEDVGTSERLAKVHEKYNDSYFKDYSLGIVAFRTCSTEKDLSLKEVKYENGKIVTIFDISSEEINTADEITKYFVFQIKKGDLILSDKAYLIDIKVNNLLDCNRGSLYYDKYEKEDKYTLDEVLGYNKDNITQIICYLKDQETSKAISNKEITILLDALNKKYMRVTEKELQLLNNINSNTLDARLVYEYFINPQSSSNCISITNAYDGRVVIWSNSGYYLSIDKVNISYERIKEKDMSYTLDDILISIGLNRDSIVKVQYSTTSGFCIMYNYPLKLALNKLDVEYEEIDSIPINNPGYLKTFFLYYDNNKAVTVRLIEGYAYIDLYNIFYVSKTKIDFENDPIQIEQPKLNYKVASEIKYYYALNYRDTDEPLTLDELDNIKIMCYHGEYNGGYVVMISGYYFFTQVINNDIIAGVVINYNDGNKLIYYKDKVFYSLKDAYNNKILNVEDLKKIAYLHNVAKHKGVLIDYEY